MGTNGTCEIFHPEFRTPDWLAIKLKSPESAIVDLRAILSHYETVMHQAEAQFKAIRGFVFNVRMCAFRIVSERELWKLEDDPGYGVPYKSMYRWMQVLYPDDSELRYAIEANTTQKALPKATLSDLSALKQCNAVVLASKFVSDTCRNDPAMIEAAKTATKREFRSTLNTMHSQQLEDLETLEFTYPAGDAAQVKHYLSWVIERANLEPGDYQGALLYLAVNENEEHNVQEQ